MDDRYPINIFNYRELTADFIDQFYTECIDRNDPNAAESVMSVIEAIKAGQFTRMAAADDVIKWHRELLKAHPIYHEFISRGFFFLLAHLECNELGDAYSTLRNALAKSVSLSFVPNNIDLQSKAVAMSEADWLKNILAPSVNMRFMTFVLLIQLTAPNQADDTPLALPSAPAGVL